MGKSLMKESPEIALAAGGLIVIGWIMSSPLFGLAGLGGSVYIIHDLVKARMSAKWEKVFTEIGLTNKSGEIPTVIDKGDNELGEYVIFELPTGLTITKIGKKEEEIEQHFRSRVEITRGPDYSVKLQIIKRKFKKTYDVDVRKGLFRNLSHKRYLIGVEIGDRPFQLDFEKGSHMLLNGGTGGGKTTLLRLIMAQAVFRGVTLLGTDMKGGAEFVTFLGYDGLVLSTDRESSYIMMTNMKDLMDRRYEYLGKSRCKDAKEYNSKHKSKMEPVLCVVDEFSPFSDDKEIKAILSIILSMARAANINVILSSQRISSRTLGNLKTNMDVRATFKTLTDADSEIALGRGNTQASKIPKEGRILLRYDGYEAKQIQCYFLDNDECKEQLKEQLQEESFVIRDRRAFELDIFTGRPVELQQEMIESDELMDYVEMEDYYIE